MHGVSSSSGVSASRTLSCISCIEGASEAALRNKGMPFTVLLRVSRRNVWGSGRGVARQGALDALTVAPKSHKVSGRLDADIRSFFYQIDHEWMLIFLGGSDYRPADAQTIGK